MRAPLSTVVLGSLAAAVANSIPASANTSFGEGIFPTYKRLPVEHAVGLTFDDGPGPGTGAFLKTLDELGAKATFFVTGEQVAETPSRLKEIVAAGHEVGLHCYRHRNHLRLAPWQVTNDIRRARSVIEDVTGRPIQLYRPPYGVFSLGSWIESGRQGWERILWARWGRDWEEQATPRSISGLIGYPSPGDILLLHDSDRYSAPDSWQRTLAALPIIAERLERTGLVARPVGELLGIGVA